MNAAKTPQGMVRCRRFYPPAWFSMKPNMEGTEFPFFKGIGEGDQQNEPAGLGQLN